MKPVLIIENNLNPLKLDENVSNKKDHVLSGPFTCFDVVNRNDRIYTANEFVPHVKTMMEKKEWGIIYGEFDHPENFSISLKNVSHLIESAYYNKNTNSVDGEIRLLNTHYGKDAKALVDDGLPLFVSSRAAGITEANGHVKLKQLFTYDIVADPGFANAKMKVKTMNESLGFKDDSNFRILEAKKEDLALLTQKYEKLSNINIYDLTDETKTNELFNMNKNDHVTKKQLSDWSKYLIEEIKKNDAKILKQVSESKGSSMASNELSQIIESQEYLKQNFEKVVKYLDYLSETVQITVDYKEISEKKLNDVVKYTNYLGENVNKSIAFQNYLAETLNKNIEYSEYLAEGLDKTIVYSNYLAESLDQTIDYSQYIAEGLDKAIDYSQYIVENVESQAKYTKYLAETLNANIDYTQYIAENLSTSINYTQYLAENIDTNIGYTQYLAENLESSITYQDYLSECIDKTMDFSNSIVEGLNKSNGSIISESFKTAEQYLNISESKAKEEEVDKKPKEEKVKEEEEECKTSETETKSEEKEEKVEESKSAKPVLESIINDKTSNQSILSKVDLLIAEAKKREASKVERPVFYEFLNPTDIKAFEALTTEQQDEIKVAINESTGYYSRQDVLAITKQVLEKDRKSPEQLLIEGMPADIKPLWEQVDTKMKLSILSQSKFYDINSQEMVENFWYKRNFNFLKNESKVLLESNNPFENMNKLSEDQLDAFTQKFNKLI